MLDQTQSNSFIPFGAPQLGVTPQGLDAGQIAGQIANQILPTLPGLILGLLSANPTLTSQVRAQSATPFTNGPQGFNPQSFSPQAFSPQSFSPQGVDFGQIAGQIAGQILPKLPGLIMSLLSTNPTLGAQVRAQSATPFNSGPQGFSPQSFSPQGANPQTFSPQGFDFGQIAGQIAGQILPALPGLILGLLSANPTLTAQVRAQSATPFAAGPQAVSQSVNQGVSPQGFDLGHLAQQIVSHVAPMLPGLVMSVLSTDPNVASQVRAQGVAPQSLVNFGINTPFGGAGFGLFGAAPTAGAVPQGFDLGHLAQQVTSHVAPLLPVLITSVLSSNPNIGSQARATTH